MGTGGMSGPRRAWHGTHASTHVQSGTLLPHHTHACSCRHGAHHACMHPGHSHASFKSASITVSHLPPFACARTLSQANGCTGAPRHWPTQWDGRKDFYCLQEGDCPGGDVIRCSWDGGHNWLFNDAVANGGLVTMFLLQWTRPSHIGCVHTTSAARTSAFAARARAPRRAHVRRGDGPRW